MVTMTWPFLPVALIAWQQQPFCIKVALRLVRVLGACHAELLQIKGKKDSHFSFSLANKHLYICCCQIFHGCPAKVLLKPPMVVMIITVLPLRVRLLLFDRGVEKSDATVACQRGLGLSTRLQKWRPRGHTRRVDHCGIQQQDLQVSAMSVLLSIHFDLLADQKLSSHALFKGCQ